MARRRVLTEEMVTMRTKCNRMDLIKNLNLWGNDLEDISVLQYMPNLEVLSLSVNCVSSLADLKYCPKLTELYLRKNEIHDLAEVHSLRHIRGLRVLWLSDNPCALLPHYRQYVLHYLPNLTKFDSLDVTEEERRQAMDADVDGAPTCAAYTGGGGGGAGGGHRDDDAPSAMESPAARSSPSAAPRRRSSDPGFMQDEFDAQGQDYAGYGHQGDRGIRRSQTVTPELPSEAFNQAPEGRYYMDGNNASGDPGQSAEFARGDFRDAHPARSAASPNAGSPQWQGRRQGSMGAASPLADSAPPRRLGGNRPAAQNGGFEQGPPQQAWGADIEVSPAQDPQQPVSATDNILCAVLALIKELDGQGLELVRRAVEQRQDDES